MREAREKKAAKQQLFEDAFDDLWNEFEVRSDADSEAQGNDL